MKIKDGHWNIRLKSSFILIAILLLSASAQAQLKKFKVEIPQPAKFRLSDSIQSFTLLNRSLSPQFENYNKDTLQVEFYKKNFEENKILLDSMVADTIIQALGELLYDSDRFDIVIPVDRNIKREISYTKTPEPLEWSYVEDVCNTYNTDALIVLENFAMRTVTNYQTGGEYIGYNYTKNHYASIDYYYRAHWRIYHPESKNILVDFIMNQDTLFWDNFEYDLYKLFFGLPSIKQAGIETGIKIAIDFSEVIAPSWIEDTRYYYLTKNSAVDKSVELAAEGNWEEALINWEQHADKGNSSNRSKIMLNVALAYEMTGDLSNAILWAKKSLKTNYREVTNHYLKELMKREIKLKN